MTNKKEIRKVLVEKVYINSQYTYDVVGWFHGFCPVGDQNEGGVYPHAIIELMIGQVVLVEADSIKFIDSPVEDLLADHPLLRRKVLMIIKGKKKIEGQINRLNSMNKGASGIAWVTKLDGSGEVSVKFKDGALCSEEGLNICLKDKDYEFKEY